MSEHFFPLLIVDHDFIRREADKSYRDALQQVQRLEAQIRIFQEKDQPAFRQWYVGNFAGTLETIEQCIWEIQKKRQLIDRVIREAEDNGLSYSDAYYNILNEGDHPEEDEAEECEQGFTMDSEDEYTRTEGRDHRSEETSRPKGEREPKRPSQRSAKELYRKLAFCLHPDKIGNEHPEFAKIWLDVQNAYEEGNSLKLEMIWNALAERFGHKPRENSVWEVRQKVKKILGELMNLKKKLRRAKREQAWGFSRGGFEEKRRRVHVAVRRELTSELRGLQAALHALDNFIEELELGVQDLSMRRAQGSRSY